MALFEGIMDLAQHVILMGCAQVEGCEEGQCVVFEVIFNLFHISGRLQHEGAGEIRES